MFGCSSVDDKGVVKEEREEGGVDRSGLVSVGRGGEEFGRDGGAPPNADDLLLMLDRK